MHCSPLSNFATVITLHPSPRVSCRRLSCWLGDGRRTSWEPAHRQFEFGFPSCSHVGSTAPSAVFFRHTCSDIRSILHRCSRCQGLRAGSPPLLPGAPRTGGCRAPGWPMPPAPRRTSSPATPPRRSSRPSVRSSCGSPRNRRPCTTSTADEPRLAFAKYPLPVEARPRGNRLKGRQEETSASRAGGRGREQVAIREDARCHTSRDSSRGFYQVGNVVTIWVQSRFLDLWPKASSTSRKTDHKPKLTEFLSPLF